MSVAQLLAAKKARPVESLDELAADTFESDQELAERRRLANAHPCTASAR
jgi:hypothetical protein